jgi:hypothetical protein
MTPLLAKSLHLACMTAFGSAWDADAARTKRVLPFVH